MSFNETATVDGSMTVGDIVGPLGFVPFDGSTASGFVVADIRGISSPVEFNVAATADASMEVGIFVASLRVVPTDGTTAAGFVVADWGITVAPSEVGDMVQLASGWASGLVVPMWM